MACTSPPYWGLRSYLPADHPDKAREIGQEKRLDCLGWARGEDCGACYVCTIRGIGRQLWRVLRDDATLWINQGDSYNAHAGQRKTTDSIGAKQKTNAGSNTVGSCYVEDLKPKDLCGQPWRIALALQADGWFWRDEIIWHKKSCMPSSQRDRCTRSHEVVLMFAKGQWSERVVRFADVDPEVVHFSRNLGANESYVGTTQVCVRLATAIFDAAQRHENFRLPPFYAEVWKKGYDHSDSDFVSSLPAVHRLTANAARLLDGDSTTKEFLCEIGRLGAYLGEGNHLLVRGSDAKLALPPRTFVDGKGAIAIHDAGKISKVDFVHGCINIQSQRGCVYFYDIEAIKEPAESGAWKTPDGWDTSVGEGGHGSFHKKGREKGSKAYTFKRETKEGEVHGQAAKQHRDDREEVFYEGSRTKRTVWSLGPEPFKEAHFATFPSKLVKPMILAGTSAHGVCAACGAPWGREVEHVSSGFDGSKYGERVIDASGGALTGGTAKSTLGSSNGKSVGHQVTVGWSPSCKCVAGVVPATVLDPFGGAGTSALVADRLGRNAILCELNGTYADMAEKRITGDSPLFSEVGS